MVAVVIIGILAAIGLTQYQSLVRKSKRGRTLANLGTLRSSLSIYYAENEQHPRDNLDCLIMHRRFLQFIPVVEEGTGIHAPMYAVIAEAAPTDTGQWSYNNDFSSLTWGTVVVGCTHSDIRGQVWTTY